MKSYARKVDVTRNEFEFEARNIVLLLAEHAEYRYKYPQKYEEVRALVLSQFKQLLSLKTGVAFPQAILDLPLETLSDCTVRNIHMMMSSVRGKLFRETKKDHPENVLQSLKGNLSVWEEMMDLVVH